MRIVTLSLMLCLTMDSFQWNVLGHGDSNIRDENVNIADLHKQINPQVLKEIVRESQKIVRRKDQLHAELARQVSETKAMYGLGLGHSNIRDQKVNTHDLQKKITKDVLEEVCRESQEIVRRRDQLHNELAKKGRVINRDERKADLSLIRNVNMDPLIHEREATQTVLDEASNQLFKRFNLSRDEINKGLPDLPLNGVLSKSIHDTCLNNVKVKDCDAISPYRKITGQCNNLQNPTWGSAMSCQQRLLPANYNGAYGYRQSVTGQPLPNPRTLSLNVHSYYNRSSNYFTHMFMFFGQLVAHDITFTPFDITGEGQSIECCPDQEETHSQCAPIEISENDPFYRSFNMTCMNFVRSIICPSCTLGARQQMNQITSFIDASFVYGSSDNEHANLRAYDGKGRMKHQKSRYGDLLPPNPNPNEDSCSFPQANRICFDAGDSRVHQHTVLTTLHTIFMREHNRIATKLSEINPHWREERLFQEARRILVAEMQNIVYKEFLPMVLGSDLMDSYQLWTGSDTEYDNTLNPSIMIEFSTAAYRFGHSMVNIMVSEESLNRTDAPLLFRNTFFQPFDLFRGSTDKLMDATVRSPAQYFDNSLVPDVTNYLYRSQARQPGLDLAAINIHRGRDHGIPTYVEMVRFCTNGNSVIKDFGHLVSYGLMKSENSRILQQNYRSVEDVDLWTGILLETPKTGAVVGPTAACLIARQFHHLKFGDRFYVEHKNQAGSFTSCQLNELRRTSLSQIICLNTKVPQMALNALLFVSQDNPLIKCADTIGVDLSFWEEKQTQQIKGCS